MAYNWQQMMDL